MRMVGRFSPIDIDENDVQLQFVGFCCIFQGKMYERMGRRNSGGLATAEDMQMVYILSKHKDYVWQGI